ncbi:cytoplasmic protein [Escherichia coli]|nr:cytoplasmic protein [Escherichia coli]EFD5381447.1 cytoplasmic protein [Escherichia coli]KAA0627080.1 cytoplasmic protein [Escherichia coli]KAB3399542.1 cytoplasmic protein [Escherichia coli]KAB3404973.1 cytoplasmic protein [Escherichia coli]
MKIRSSPVEGFSDNKRHSFHLSGRVFSGRRGFFIYYTSKS